MSLSVIDSIILYLAANQFQIFVQIYKGTEKSPQPDVADLNLLKN